MAIAIIGALLFIISTGLCATEGNQDLQGKSLSFEKQTFSNYAILHPKKPLNLDAFTLCLRVSAEPPGNRDMILFSYFGKGADQLNLWRERDGRFSLYLASSVEGVFFSLPQISTFGTQLCVTWESSSGTTAFWVDGKMSVRKTYRQHHKVPGGGTVILGQDQDLQGGGFDASQSFVGEVTNVNLWDYVLPCEFTSEAFALGGNVINWGEVQCKIVGEVKMYESGGKYIEEQIVE
ncbi:C-reactive protein precursor [Xenopus tropicalis]|uniref:Pentraxin family member n=1 Tax=Xenopus tropicalis TaxID=8364 RepID=Q6DIV9_XENTR|eukprot:NP_001006708.1 C-reactive protein precursor [Xenopus tropicalis]